MIAAVPDWVIGLDAGAAFVIGFVGGALWLLVKVVLDDRRQERRQDRPGAPAGRARGECATEGPGGPGAPTGGP